MEKEKVTIVAFNSVGILYEMKTKIEEITESEKEVKVIHRPKGKKQNFKHTYTKDSSLKIYKGWLDTGINEQEIFESYGEEKEIAGELLYKF